MEAEAPKHVDNGPRFSLRYVKNRRKREGLARITAKQAGISRHQKFHRPKKDSTNQKGKAVTDYH